MARFARKLGASLAALAAALALTSSSLAQEADGFQAAAASRAPLAAAAKKVAAIAMHRFGPDAQALRFEGELAARTWPIYVTAEQAQSRARVHVAYSNAISVMPEASTIEISVDDNVIARSRIDAGSDPAAVDVELPRGLLQAGYNAVKVTVEQRHRVDCSIAATYELWTQLDVATSGLAFPGLADIGYKSLDDLAAVSPDATGATPIQLILKKGATNAEIDHAMRVVEAVAIRGGYARPVVAVSPAVTEGPGVSVIAASPQDIADQGFAATAATDGSPQLVAAGASGHPLVVAPIEGTSKLDAILGQILPPRRVEARSATASAARAFLGLGGFRVTGDSRLTFRELGVPTKEFSGRLFRAGFDLVMPPDFYPADYDKLTLLIDAGYSAGLDPASQLLVRVNEREAASLPLRNPKGDLFLRRPVTVSLSALRPGLNHVSVEAQTNAATDKACDAHALTDVHKRFVLLDSSELFVPGIARIARMPSLAASAATGFPYGGQEAAHLYLPHLSDDSIGAAATLLARMAVGARRPMRTSLTTQKLDLVAGSAILVGAVGAFAQGAFDLFGIDHDGLSDGWAHLAAGAPLVEAGAEPVQIEAQTQQGEVYDQWSDNAESARWSLNPVPALKSWFDRYVGVRSSDFAFYRDADAKFSPESKAMIVIAQAQAPSGGRDTWTLVVAPNDAELARDMRSLTAPSAWAKIEGRAVAFEPKSGSVTVHSGAGGYFIETAQLTPVNFRLIAAGWLSSNVDAYVFIVLVVALLLGALTAFTVRLYGVRT